MKTGLGAGLPDPIIYGPCELLSSDVMGFAMTLLQSNTLLSLAYVGT